MTKLLAALLILGANSYVYWQMGTNEVVPPRAEFATFPNEMSGWTCGAREVLEDEVIDNLGVTDYISCTFYDANGDPQKPTAAHLYVGYHERQTRDRQSGKAQAIHPPEHCLPGSGWDIIDTSLVPVDFGAGGEAKRLIIAKGNARSLVYFWYSSRGRVIARSHEKILYIFLDRATKGRSDGSLVRFTVPILNGDLEEAEAVFARFSQEVSSNFSSYVPD